MADARLNSMHLDSARREHFRQARGMLLGSVGEYTRIAAAEEATGGDERTVLEHAEVRQADSEEYALFDNESVYPLRLGVNTIGRMPDNDVVLKNPYVSRRHCAVLVHAGKGCELYDVASKNGTYLNGNLLNGPTPLSSGDEIRMSDHQLRFVRRAELPGAGDGPTRAD